MSLGQGYLVVHTQATYLTHIYTEYLGGKKKSLLVWNSWAFVTMQVSI